LEDKTILLITGIISITLLEAAALSQGINGIVLTASIGTIATIIGYGFGKGAIKIPEIKNKQNKIKGEI